MEIYIVTSNESSKITAWFNLKDAEEERERVQESLEYGGSRNRAYVKIVTVK